MTEYADPDLETVAPLPPPLPEAVGPPPPSDRGPLAAIIVALVVVSLVVGFATATLVLNARDSGSDENASGRTPTTRPGGSGPATTAPRIVPADPDEGVLGNLILRQSDVAAASNGVVQLLNHGADLTVATLDLCNGTFPTEAKRTARRQVALATPAATTWTMSTEAILYRGPSVGAQALREIKAVADACPSTPVTSPVGEETVITTFRAAPDGSWPRTPSVERLAYDFVTVSPTTGQSSHSVVVYLRRGRVLMGVYFGQPDGKQPSVDGRTTIAGIVAEFEARMAKVPERVVARGG